MGYYRSKSTEKLAKGDTWKWAAAVVLSALVGSGATLAVTPLIASHNSTLVDTSGTSSSSTPVSTNVSVNVSSDITKVVKQAEPDVVAVVNYTTSSSPYSDQSQTQESDIGSGVYFYKNGNEAYIVTNNHVVEGGSKVEIVLQSKKQVQATVVGTDPYTDLAVLKVPASTFQSVDPIQFANSDDIQVGEPAIAIGTPMGLDFADTVTSGIVSGSQRTMPVEEPTSEETLDYQSVIQTDAAINPGNSGGPLLNASGQMIGINSSKIVEQDFEGMGFAIPANEVQQITSEIIKTGHAIHPSIGIEGVDMSTVPEGYVNVPVNYGVYVESVTSSDAKNAGLKAGDVIIALNGTEVQGIADLRTELFKMQPGQMVKVTIYRGSTKKTLNVKVGEEQSVNTTDSGNNSDGSDSQGNGGYSYGQGGQSEDPLDPFSGFGN
ncbi:S1C family serine protease [Alicyclobacillus fastidiosus]|uniref:Trypsin-like peptidase domain-containing protein n=1 Tax=Alicyclobacillus fastidiosus TaxID=392011 RepID=A0ABV5AKV3_9BACL|nr:trypsin-like peptidase domain-containing protein [Alicyclobacillus fastidiosus]WEH10182.1 trypsin-like peptidase domain-containing protein [Alicyclobacillus fastidiosus]